MISFTVYVGSPSGEILAATTTKPDLSGDDVLLRVTASGLCGTDLHFRLAGIALGHEGVGVVEELGPACTRLRKGDRVGWGYLHGSCDACMNCNGGKGAFCTMRKTYSTTTLDQGSMATGAIWSEAFLHSLPDSISDRGAAPLMCAGATVFNALPVPDHRRK